MEHLKSKPAQKADKPAQKADLFNGIALSFIVRHLKQQELK